MEYNRSIIPELGGNGELTLEEEVEDKRITEEILLVVEEKQIELEENKMKRKEVCCSCHG